MTMTTRLCALLAMPLAASAAPTVVHHQGRLLDASGEGLSGTMDLTFDLMDAPSSGASHWSELHQGVPLNGGYYAVLLGNTAPLDSDALGGERWLAVTVGSSELSRVRLASVPWALRTQVASGVQLEGIAAGTTATTCLASEIGTLRFNTDTDNLQLCRANSGDPSWGISEPAATSQGTTPSAAPTPTAPSQRPATTT